MLHQAKAKSVQVSEAMVRVEIDAMCDLSRWKELTDRFQDTIETLSDESLLRFGHASAAQARPELLQLARDEAARRTETEAAPRIANMLQHLYWEMLLDAGDSATVSHKLEQAGVTPQCTSVIELYFATRAYSEDEALRSRFVDRVAELAPVSDEPQALAMGARGSLIVTLRVASQGLTQLSPKLSRLNKFDESRSGESFGEHQALVVLTNLSHRPKEMLFVPQNDFKHLTRHDPESIN